MFELIPDFNYLVVVILLMTGLYIVIASPHFIKKIMGLSIFQTAVFLLFISIGKLDNGTAPILDNAFSEYSNPLPHVLILTAIVVGVATTSLGLALVVRIKTAYGTLDEDYIDRIDSSDD